MTAQVDEPPELAPPEEPEEPDELDPEPAEPESDEVVDAAGAAASLFDSLFDSPPLLAAPLAAFEPPDFADE